MSKYVVGLFLTVALMVAILGVGYADAAMMWIPTSEADGSQGLAEQGDVDTRPGFHHRFLGGGEMHPECPQYESWASEDADNRVSSPQRSNRMRCH